MITYFVTAAHRYTMDIYLQSWGAALRPIIKVHNYGQLAEMEWLPGGTYIVSDLERLTHYQRALAAEVWNQLQAAAPNVRLLNHPTQVVLRAELLRTLHATGRNEFNAYRVSETRTPGRFPVFLRRASDHEGSRTDLLSTQGELDNIVLGALCHGLNAQDLLIVEYRSAVDADGIHHKFAAFNVGGQIIPRHLIFSRHWVLKMPDLIDAEKLASERDYLQTNPHEQVLRETFQLAHVDYGRCDYAVVNGRIQIWEINTNPIVMLPPEKYQPDHLPLQEPFAAQIREAFEAINLEADPQLKIPLHLDRALIDRVVTTTVG